MCRRPCIYKPADDGKFDYDNACGYAFQNDRTRTMTIAERFGVSPGSPEHRELMKPENCPLFIPRRGINMRTVTDAYGTKKVKKVKEKPYVPPADEKRLLELYAAGLSDLTIARIVGSSEHRIRWWRKKRGFTKHKAPRE